MVPPVVTMSRWSMGAMLSPGQVIPKRIEQLAVARAAGGVGAQRLADLGSTGRAHAAPGAVEGQAGRVEVQPAAIEQGAGRSLLVGHEVLVPQQCDALRVTGAPGIHGPLAAAQAGRDVVEAAGEM